MIWPERRAKEIFDAAMREMEQWEALERRRHMVPQAFYERSVETWGALKAFKYTIVLVIRDEHEQCLDAVRPMLRDLTAAIELLEDTIPAALKALDPSHE